jgi:hypothetical protein
MAVGEPYEWDANRLKQIEWPPGVIRIPLLAQLPEASQRIPNIWDGPIDRKAGTTLIKDVMIYRNRRNWKLYVSCRLLGEPRDYPHDKSTSGAIYLREPDGQIFYLDDLVPTWLIGHIHRKPGICPEDVVFEEFKFESDNWKEFTSGGKDYWESIGNDNDVFLADIAGRYWVLSYLIHLGLIRVNDSKYVPRDKYVDGLAAI